ncbi:MAG: UDP-3-O-(3-hydroxymyristoyl)glucosamine N-acyltransferase [Verrucomicrobiaceae bacterium]|nr:UDP-3-O-(3-hydroxymyristoyl)glucosamine N-acyltransferase [Verrucomicrobiaceae bacterium]
MQIEIRELAERLAAEPVNPLPGDGVINGLASLREAGPRDLSFFHHGRYLDDLRATRAGAVLVARDFNEDIDHVPLLKVDSPSLAFDEVGRELLAPAEPLAEKGIHATAVVADDVELNPATASIGANVVVGSGSVIGDATVIGSGVSIGSGVRIGNGCHIYPNVTLYERTVIGEKVIVHAGAVLGADGFGFEFDGEAHRKIEHFGFVQIDDEVEIGANTTIDRGRFGATRVGEGTKIDNLVQIGHNVSIGRHCIIVADSAIAGSARLGDYVTLAAQVGVAGHIEVGSFSVLTARAGVTKSLPGGTPQQPAFYAGFPAGPAERARKEMVYPRKVPDILRRLRKIERNSPEQD